jgi:PiT family inorganic phosphate transporter
MRPTTAVIWGAGLNFLGAMIGTEVAATVGKGLIDAASIGLPTVLCTLIAAIIWNLLTWWKGLPTSSSHALIGALLGATFFASGSAHIHWGAARDKILVPMIASPLLGLTTGFLLMIALIWGVYKIPVGRVNRVFGRLQIVSSGFMALSHGRNDAQKSMGIIALALMLAHPGAEFVVPAWVKISCAVVIALGTMSGGWRIVRTMGSKMMELKPIHGFAAETSAALVISGASALGMPVSTTHIISTSIMGAGATKGLSAVRWGVVGNIVWAWVLTLPAAFVLGGGIMVVYMQLFY